MGVYTLGPVWVCIGIAAAVVVLAGSRLDAIATATKRSTAGY